MKHLNFSALPVGSQIIPKEGPYAYHECISLVSAWTYCFTLWNDRFLYAAQCTTHMKFRNVKKSCLCVVFCILFSFLHLRIVVVDIRSEQYIFFHRLCRHGHIMQLQNILITRIIRFNSVLVLNSFAVDVNVEYLQLSLKFSPLWILMVLSLTLNLICSIQHQNLRVISLSIIFFLHMIQSDFTNLSAYVFQALKSANVLRCFCCHYLQRWAAHQTFTRLTSLCTDAGHVKAQRSTLTAISQLLILAFPFMTFDQDTSMIWLEWKAFSFFLILCWWVCTHLKKYSNYVSATQKPLQISLFN